MMARKSLKKKPVKTANPNGFCSCDQRLNPFALAYASAVLSSVGMLALSLFGKFGYCLSAIEMMKAWHFSYSLTTMGIIGGMAEAGLCGLILGFLFGKMYNRLV
jgi:hypothetical protein